MRVCILYNDESYLVVHGVEDTTQHLGTDSSNRLPWRGFPWWWCRGYHPHLGPGQTGCRKSQFYLSHTHCPKLVGKYPYASGAHSVLCEKMESPNRNNLHVPANLCHELIFCVCMIPKVRSQKLNNYSR